MKRRAEDASGICSSASKRTSAQAAHPARAAVRGRPARNSTESSPQDKSKGCDERDNVDSGGSETREQRVIEVQLPSLDLFDQRRCWPSLNLYRADRCDIVIGRSKPSWCWIYFRTLLLNHMLHGRLGMARSLGLWPQRNRGWIPATALVTI